MRVIARSLAAVAFTALAFSPAACGGNDDATATGKDDGPVKIRIAWGQPGDEIKYLLKADPSLTKNQGSCYALEWKQLANTAQGMQELSAGSLDEATVGSLAVANAITKGTDVVLVGENFAEKKPNFTTTWLVRADSGINSAAGLKGKKVATSGVGTSTYYLQLQYLTNAGLEKDKDYQVVELPYPQQEEALATGKIDVGVFAQPFYGKAMATGKFKPLFTVSDVLDNVPQLLQVFTDDFVTAHPKAAKCFVEDYQSVAKFVLDPANKDKVINVTAQTTQGKPEQLAYLLTDKDYFRPVNGALDIEALQRSWDFFKQAGVWTKNLTVTDYIDQSILPKA